MNFIVVQNSSEIIYDAKIISYVGFPGEECLMEKSKARPHPNFFLEPYHP